MKESTKDLQYDLCSGCGEKAPKGFIESVMHVCPGNTITYRAKSFKLWDWENLFTGRHPLQSFYDLLHYPHLRAMSNFDTATNLEKKIYSLCRYTELSAMKRMRDYIKLEEEFDSKY